MNPATPTSPAQLDRAPGPEVGVGTYVLVLIALLLLWVLTAGLDFVPLGPWHLAASLAIATLKAALVALYFMHLRYAHGLTRLFGVAGLVWLGVLIVLTLSDYLTRNWLVGAS